MTRPTAGVAVLGATLLLGIALFALRGGDGRGTPRAPDDRAGDGLEAAAEAIELQGGPDPEPAKATPAASLATDFDAARPSDATPARLPAESAPAGAALVFRVVDARTVQPLETFEVRLGQRYLRPLLNDEGRIRLDFPGGEVRFPGVIEGLAGESVALSVGARGFEELRIEDVYVAPGRDLDLGTLRLQRGPRITVSVLDDATGEPVTGARVTLIWAFAFPPSPGGLDPWSDITDPHGRVLLTSKPGEPARITVRHAEHEPFEVERVLPLAEEHQETVRLKRLPPR